MGSSLSLREAWLPARQDQLEPLGSGLFCGQERMLESCELYCFHIQRYLRILGLCRSIIRSEANREIILAVVPALPAVTSMSCSLEWMHYAATNGPPKTVFCLYCRALPTRWTAHATSMADPNGRIRDGERGHIDGNRLSKLSWLVSMFTLSMIAAPRPHTLETQFLDVAGFIAFS